MKTQTFLLMCILPAILCTHAQAKIIYVDDDAAGTNDGSSWQNAYTFLQDALTDANSSEKPVEIRVAQGTYKPDQGTGQTAGDRETSFQLINNVTLSGGYTGVNEPDLNKQNIEKYETILSGDLSGNDIELDNAHDLVDVLSRRENSYHVVNCSDTNETAVLNGFTVTGGNANIGISYHASTANGGGIYNLRGSPIISNCLLCMNSAIFHGGGMYNNNCHPTLYKCTFKKNSVKYLSGTTYIDPALYQGGGLYNMYSNSTIKNCIFEWNLAENEGGGMYSSESVITLNNCIFNENMAVNHGGGICNDYYNKLSLLGCAFLKNHAESGGGIYSMGKVFSKNELNFYDCIFTGNCANSGGAISVWYSTLELIRGIVTGNKTSHYAGGLCIGWPCHVTLMNCTFVGNSSPRGNAIGCTSRGDIHSILELKNCILWDDSYEIINSDGSEINISYCDIKGGLQNIDDSFEKVIWDVGKIETDPCFVDHGFWDPNGTLDDANDDFWMDGDYHLKSQAGRYDPNIQSWIKDDVTSPCIDAGDPNSPIGLEPFPNGTIINMGAYGGTEQASKSLSDVLFFRDFWPFETGNRWWNSYAMSDAGIDFEIIEHFDSNSFDIWHFEYEYVEPLFGRDKPPKDLYWMYVDGDLYKTSDINDIDSLPNISGKMQLKYPEKIQLNEPICIPALEYYGNLIAFHGTLEEVLELSQTHTGLSEETRYSANDFLAGNHGNVLGFASNSDKGTKLLELYGYHFGPMLQGIYIMDGTVDIETLVRITKPTENKSFQRNETIEIEAEVIHTTSPVIKMEFMIDIYTPQIGTDIDGGDGWSIQWKILFASATLPLRVRATTESGMIVNSKAIYINVQ